MTDQEHICELQEQLAAEQDLITEIAEESAIEFKDKRLRYHVIQMTTATWDKLQARYAVLAKEAK